MTIESMTASNGNTSIQTVINNAKRPPTWKLEAAIDFIAGRGGRHVSGNIAQDGTLG